MPRQSDRPAYQGAIVRYALAVVVFAAGLALRAAMLPQHAGFSFATFYPLSVAAFWYLGSGPGILFACLAALSAGTVLLPGPVAGQPSWSVDLAIALFMGGSLACGWVIHQMRVAQRERNLANQRESHARALYAAILGDQTEWIARFRQNGELVYVNDAFCKAFGVKREDVLGKAWKPMAHPDDVPYIDGLLASLSAAHPVVTIENRVYLANGQLAWGSFINRGIFDQGRTLLEIQSVGRDISAHKALEAERDAAASRAADLYDNAPCGYYSLAEDGTITNANRTMQDWLGVPLAQLAGQRRITEFMTEGSRAYFAARFPEFKRSGSLSGAEFDLVSAHGHLRHVSVTANAVRDAEGRFLFSRSTMHDITPLDKARRELQAMQDRDWAILNNDMIGIARIKDRRLVWANRGLHRIFGYAEGELDGHATREFFCDESKYEEIGAAGYQVLQNGEHYRTRSANAPARWP